MKKLTMNNCPLYVFVFLVYLIYLLKNEYKRWILWLLRSDDEAKMMINILVCDCWRFVVVVVVFSLQSTENTTKNHYMYETPKK